MLFLGIVLFAIWAGKILMYFEDQIFKMYYRIKYRNWSYNDNKTSWRKRKL